jgi:Sulfotransferase family
MYNLIILGSGRSGTSMATALFRASGYFFGDSMLTPDNSNPFGYYEDLGLNHLNAAILTRLLFYRTKTILCPWLLNPIHRDVRAAWVAAPRFLVPRKLPRHHEDQVRRYATRTPFCYKDPRFSVTLPAWRPYLPKDTRFLVVFREPDRTVDSLLQVSAKDYDPPLPLTPRWAYLHWARNYRRLLDRFSNDGDWLFVDYNSIIEHSSIPAIEAFSGAKLDVSELDPSVRRSQSTRKFGDLREARQCYAIHERLLERSARDIARWGQPGGSLPESVAVSNGKA